MPEQQNLFQSESNSPQTKLCERCAKRCRVAEQVNPKANLFVKGTIVTGRFCAECLVVDFFKNSEHGPSSSLGKEFFDTSLPLPAYRKDRGDIDVRFDPEAFRLPHVREQFASILRAAEQEYGAELRTTAGILVARTLLGQEAACRSDEEMRAMLDVLAFAGIPLPKVREEPQMKKRIFVECRVCGERWSIGVTPIPIDDLVKIGKSAKCKTCGERDEVFLCPSVGRDAVTEPRTGKKPA